MPPEETTPKRKQPPTFRHLPAKRAQKLKQVWVRNKKIKTQWKAQKRKERLRDTSSGHIDVQEESSVSNSNSDSEHDVHAEEDEKELRPRKMEAPPPASLTRHHQQKQQQQTAQQIPDRRKKQKVTDDADANADTGPSLRELTREAYSRSSLHTFKAKNARRRGGGADGRGRGGGSERYQDTGIGRGQPNMKLRMNAMLERIKQTMA